MSYTKTEWRSGDIISTSRLNHIENGIEELSLNSNDYDLVIESNGNIQLPGVYSSLNFNIIKGNILDCEQKIADGEPVNGVCILHNDWSGTSKNITQLILILPLTYWHGPYSFMGFGGVFYDYHESANNPLEYVGVCIYYDYTDGSILHGASSISSSATIIQSGSNLSIG